MRPNTLSSIKAPEGSVQWPGGHLFMATWPYLLLLARCFYVACPWEEQRGRMGEGKKEILWLCCTLWWGSFSGRPLSFCSPRGCAHNDRTVVGERRYLLGCLESLSEKSPHTSKWR